MLYQLVLIKKNKSENATAFIPLIPVNRDELLKVSRETHHFMRNKIVQQIISQKKKRVTSKNNQKYVVKQR